MAKSCKYGKVKSGHRKGQCRKRKLSGGAAKARRCKGNKGAAFKACMSTSLHGLGKMKRRKSRR